MSLLDEARKLEQSVVKRLKELEPLLREYDQLRKLGERLGVRYTPGPAQEDAGAQAAKPAAARTRASRGRAAKTAAKPRGARSTTARKTGRAAKADGATAKVTVPPAKSATAKATAPRAKGSRSDRRTAGRSAATRPGQRTDDVLRLVRENPGITVREIGERLGVDATGLYRVANRLTTDGNVRKDGTRLYPAEAATGGAQPAVSDAAAASGSDGQAMPPEAAKETTTTGDDS
jgi:hypothetical protein